MALPPPSKLARYRMLAPNCGLKVSPFMLGAMSIGQADAATLGSIEKKDAFELLDFYYQSGGNAIDTANAYQGEESEIWIGEWMKDRKIPRDDLVIITKYTANYRHKVASKHPISVNRGGNSYKSMYVSVEESLKKLQVDYIDILYIHWWDWATPIPEVMQGLNNLVRSGKVLYLGASDTPAWVISRANEYARNHGLAPFVLYQGRYSAADRDLERDLLPMCWSEGMGVAPWGAIGQGMFQRAKEYGTSKDGRSKKEPSERQRKVSAAMEKVADELQIESVTAVAIAYVMSKYPYLYPILGGRSIKHLKDNMAALDIHLSPAQVASIESALPFDFGQPMSQFGLDPHMTGFQGHDNLQTAGLVDYVPQIGAIDMTKGREGDKASHEVWKKANPSS